MSLVRKQFIINAETSFECVIFIIKKENGQEFWFKGRNIAEFLEYKRPRDAIHDHVDSVWKKTWLELWSANQALPDAPIIQPHTVFISEPGLYALVNRSKKPEAVKFTKWLYEEVLPSLRKTGSYAMKRKNDKEDNGQLLKINSLEMELRVQKTEHALEIQKYRVALIEKDKQIAEYKHKSELLEMNRQQTVCETLMLRILNMNNEQQNKHMRESLESVGERVVAPLDIPAKEEMLVVFENDGGLLQIARVQHQTYETILDAMASNRVSSKRWFNDKSYKQIGEPVYCANAKNMWLYIRTKRPEAFGLSFESSNRNKNTVRVLNEEELRLKYRNSENNTEFKDEEDCVARALVRSSQHLMDIIKLACEEIIPKPPSPPAPEDINRELNQMMQCYIQQNNSYVKNYVQNVTIVKSIDK